MTQCGHDQRDERVEEERGADECLPRAQQTPPRYGARGGAKSATRPQNRGLPLLLPSLLPTCAGAGCLDGWLAGRPTGYRRYQFGLWIANTQQQTPASLHQLDDFRSESPQMK
ncbi:hypothetical protein RB195_025854 [Necator americanus]|uniref:Uncharacterized protein n=1 Tax=Necator americanus TaxID=51031 RepID=A0ABR1EUD7_NECAM